MGARGIQDSPLLHYLFTLKFICLGFVYSHGVSRGGAQCRQGQQV
jgi:hypothetical protein